MTITRVIPIKARCGCVVQDASLGDGENSKEGLGSKYISVLEMALGGI